MKKRFNFIAGMLTMALLFGMVGTAYAAYQKQATLNYPGIKITLDGDLVTPLDAAGNLVEPFTIDGTTYLPVRAIGNALGLGVDWDGTTNTVILTSPEDGWENYIVCDCYRDFSVPSFENIVGTAALVGVYELSTGDSVLYTYDPKKFNVAQDSNCFAEYFALLGEYGFEHEGSDGTITYLKSTISGVTVATYWEEHDNFCVLLMPSEGGEPSGLDAETVSYAWRISQYAERVHTVCDRAARYASNGSGSAAEVQDVSTAFYDKTLPVLDVLREDKSNDQMYGLYMAAYNLTETAEEMIYRFAQLETRFSKTTSDEFISYSTQEVNEYWDILDFVGSILSPER